MSLARLALVSLALVAPSVASAYFEEAAVDARIVAMGESAIADARGVSAYYWNPAGLVDLDHRAALVDYTRPYGVTDVNIGSIAIGSPVRGSNVALAWHHLGVASAYAEDLLHVAAARTVWASRSGHRIAAGATFKFGRVGFQSFIDPVTGGTVDYGSQSKGMFDAALQWTAPRKLTAVWVVRDILSPTYRLIDGSEGGKMRTRSAVAAALRWHRESTLTASWSQLPETGKSALNVGLEIRYYGVFAIRSGLTEIAHIYDANGSPNDFQFTGGFGITHDGWAIDAAAMTNRDLGATYRVTLGHDVRPRGSK